MCDETVDVWACLECGGFHMDVPIQAECARTNFGVAQGCDGESSRAEHRCWSYACPETGARRGLSASYVEGARLAARGLSRA
ncbi:MAG TPA: hypothetical protein PKO36_13065 [Candidatus Hydrogenedentes bacterium]|nr:hypothetical protein [Candidatus Hydrogenedentota bacterium]HOV74826.1 hypothetical protein [Candidatus Hydrogenedentota bacterium]